MVPLLSLFLSLLFSPRKPISRLEVENALRHQPVCCNESFVAGSNSPTVIACSSWCYIGSLPA
jgi:hypothetical protein